MRIFFFLRQKETSKKMAMIRRSSTIASQESSVPRGPRLLKVPKDFPTIQQALDAAKNDDGVFITPARYVLDSPLMITKSIHLIGVDEVGQSAQIVFQTDLGHLSALRVDPGQGNSCRIKGLQIELLQTQAATSVVSLNSGDIILDECVVTGRGGCSGISVAAGCYATLTCVKCVSQDGTAVRVAGKTFLDRCELTASAIGASTSGAGRISAQGTFFSDCRKGIVASGSCDVRLASTAFSRCGTGVSLDVNLHIGNGKVPEIKGCEFVQCQAGIELGGEEVGCGIYKNYIHDCTVAGIRVLQGSPRVEVRANAIKQCRGDGIVVLRGSPIVESNVIEGIDGAGIVIGGGRPIVRLNEVVRCKQTPFSLGLLVAPAVVDDESSPASDADEIPLSTRLIGLHKKQPASPASQERSRSPQGDQSVALVATTPSPALAAQEELLVVDPNLLPDPMVEMNMLAENRVNIMVLKGVGTFQKNDLLPAAEENVYIAGSVGRLTVCFRSNEVLGSSSTDEFVLGPNARAQIIANVITDCRLSGVTLVTGVSFAEIASNTFRKCQTAVTAMKQARGKIIANVLNGLPLLFKGDASATVVAADNVE